MERKYRIVTNDDVFRIELFQSWTYRGGWFFLKKITREQWVPCDNIGGDCYSEDCDGDCYYDESEIVEYDSIEQAQAKIEQWTTPPAKAPEPTWKVVWPKA